MFREIYAFRLDKLRTHIHYVHAIQKIFHFRFSNDYFILSAFLLTTKPFQNRLYEKRQKRLETAIYI